MFFKSRTQRDIDDFRAMQDRGSRRIQQGSRPIETETAAKTASAAEEALGLEAGTGARIVKELARGTSEHQQSVVSANAVWQGKLTTEGSAWLEGEMSGEVEAGETVFIVRGAKVRATIRARRAIIGGDMEGQIICREQLVVEHSGRLGGKVSTQTLVIENGAVVHSEIRMLRDDETAPSTTRGASAGSRPAAAPSGPTPGSEYLKAGQILQPASKAFGQDRKE